MGQSGKRILLWHGYLLSGSGSNILAANLARTWREAGHHVLVLCQETGAARLPFVDAQGGFSAPNSSWDAQPTGAIPALGSCTVVRPDIGGLLPVYVQDDYEGFEVKRFVDLSEAELKRYVATNTAALVTAIRRHRPDAIFVGHEVMGPYIAREACALEPAASGSGFIVLLHGSALEYAVKPQRRYRRYAYEGLRAAFRVVGGSRYMVSAASSIVAGWEERAEVVNPGCDIALFAPVERSTTGRAVVGFVGKLIAAKGVHNLLAATGLITRSDVELDIVGYGGFESGLRKLAAALQQGDVERAAAVAREGEGEPLPDLAALLRSVATDAGYWARARAARVEFKGRLDHAALAPVLPLFDVLVVPSVVPEAFGMVAVEAAACGVLPIYPRHSGIGEVGAAIEDHLGVRGLLGFDPADPISGIAAALDRVLALPADLRSAMSDGVADLARRRWSWERSAQNLLALTTPF